MGDPKGTKGALVLGTPNQDSSTPLSVTSKEKGHKMSAVRHKKHQNSGEALFTSSKKITKASFMGNPKGTKGALVLDIHNQDPSAPLSATSKGKRDEMSAVRHKKHKKFGLGTIEKCTYSPKD